MSRPPVSAEEWKRLEPVLDAALALPADRRPAYLHAACGDDADMRLMLEQMLAHADTPDPLLDLPASERFAALLASGIYNARIADTSDGLTEGLTAALAGRYEIVREIGRGGMATVYLARDVRHDREVALKMLRQSVGTLLGADRFHTEIRVTASLRHPHVLPLFDSGEVEGRLFYVMPYIEGGSLRDLLDGVGPIGEWTPRRGRLPAPQALRIMSQIASALAEAHARGVVHRDLKPENILLTGSGEHAYLADFGIALAAAHDPIGRVTRPGFVLGTPTYMSPEQLRGEPDLDGRSDIYSMGRVLHEMLVGTLPPDGGLPLDSPLRSTPMGALVTRAIAPARDQRFPSASELVRAIEDASRVLASAPSSSTPSSARLIGAANETTAEAITTPSSHQGDADARALLRSRRTTRIAAGALLTAAAVFWLTTRGHDRSTEPVIDPDAVAVLPFRLDAGDESPMLSGDNTARLLYDALARWERLTLSDEMRVADAMRTDRRAADTLSVEGARGVAHRLGAGRFVWGEVSTLQGGLRVRAQLYMPGRSEPYTQVVHMAAGADVASAFSILADSLVARLAGAPGGSPPAIGTRNFEALKRYADGHVALSTWDTRAAEEQFRAAIALDSGFAQASLALAQSMAWSGRARPAAWRASAARAVADSMRLPARERGLARALLALGESRANDACAEYRAMLSRTPNDFAAQYGMGECLSYDRRIVRDTTDTTQWRFQANRTEAIAAYSRALELVPSYFEAARGAAFSALARRVIFTGETDYRQGFALAPDTVRMGAFPELRGDSVVYRPLPMASLFRTPAPATHRAAIARNRETLRALTARWTQSHPRSMSAWLRHAEALEALGSLESEGPGTSGALQAVRTARALAATDATLPGDLRANAAATEVRVLLKLGRFDDARLAVRTALADTTQYTETLAAAADGTDDQSGLPVLAALAALTGRAQLAARLLEMIAVRAQSTLWLVPSGSDLTPPAPVLRAAGMFSAYAALGAPIDSVRGTRSRVEREIATWVPRDATERVRALLLARSSMLAQPGLGTAALNGLSEPEPYDDLLVLWQQVARGDTAPVHARLTAPSRAPVQNVARAPEWLVQRAQLAIALRDTSVAMGLLDELIASLPAQLERLTREHQAAAAVGRALILRAQLPRGAGDAPRKAARAVSSLWADADPPLRAMAAAAAAPHR
ncbi:MAG TPA: serine/threonine protein kinase [Gemmatimonas aurantiaca]|uniref:Serine/threonine protein kinase n=2 Tax=Gemmatimonas aurantiaca TaxID=173480 RepID=A0A3D4VA05_9BACT|nr:serine/threonine-protein kinase [Gemmatimonas aurantiaca]BAH40043.1 putative serine/threonine protein kinase [Gemmatimonas aurantiaca T-27]HCT57949.1 serine/threonine protein kinase [Gemmatimonas aurantiaca]